MKKAALEPRILVEDIPTDELIKELLERFNHALFFGANDDECVNINMRRWMGNDFKLIGMCTDLQLDIRQDMRSRDYTR